jgi:CBS domain containing-hemolysin-like protein
VVSGEYLFDLVWKLGAVIALVLLNGFFVAAEFAVVKIRDTQLVRLAETGHRRARVARRLIGNLDAALSATQLGITLASLGLGWIGEPVFASLLEPVLNLLQIESEQLRHSLSFAVGFSLITFLHIVAGELAPKSLAIRKALPTTLWVALPLDWFYRASYPAIWLLNHAADWLLRRLGIEPVSEAELAHSEEELRLLLTGPGRGGHDAGFGRRLVLNAFDLRHRVAREVMRPRREIVALDLADPLERCLEIAEKTRYSRFPLCEGGDPDRALGVVHFKDLFALRTRARTAADLLPAARKLLYVAESARLDRLLQLFLERRLHLALVVDEYGSTVGLVTLENVLEELVGQIQDEFDQETPLCVRTGPDTWELDGQYPLHELAELVGQPLQAEDLATTSGLVTHRLGGFPRPGDCVDLGDFRLCVEETDGPRVTRLKLTRLRAPPPG